MKKEKLFKTLDTKVGFYKQRLELLQFKINNNPNYLLLYRILEDSLTLSKDIYIDIYIDIYMYDLSMENYNNEQLFLGNYYCDYAVVKINMMWERVIFFLGYIYGVEFDKVSRKNTWDSIYKKLKKKPAFTEPLKNLLEALIGNYAFGKIKTDRNTNEHDVSVHLTDKLKGVKFDDKYQYHSDERGFPVLDEDVYMDFMNLTSKLARENKKETIQRLKKSLDIYTKIFSECISIFENETINKRSNIVIENKQHYSFDYTDEMKKYFDKMVNKKQNLYVKMDTIQKRFLVIRERVKKIADIINMNPVLVYQRPPTIQILQYNIDSAYRSVELVRSLIIELAIINQHIDIDTSLIDTNLTSYMYYHNYALIRLYSLFEKISKLLYTRFELNDYQGNKKDLKNVYIQRVVQMAVQEGLNEIKPMKMLADIILSKEYKLYEEIRNKSYHCIRFEFVLEENQSEEFFVFTLGIMSDLLEKLAAVLEVIEDGEEANVNMAKYLRLQEF